MAETKYKDWTLEAIIDYCKAHGEVKWLKETAAKQVERKVYPKVESTSKSGKKSWKLDKSAEPTTEMQPISFVELKSEFIAKFIDKNHKAKKQSMYDIIANL